MADQRIDQLNAETTPAAVDVLPVFSIAGADTKKITVKNLVQVGATLIDNGSIPGSKLNLTGLLTGTVVNADIAAAAGIVDTKLATIATAGKVSNSATSATNANTASAIVARDASGNFTAGTITAALTGNAATVTTNANLTGDITSTGNATSIAAGVIIDADINASAAIVDTKLATIATAGKVSNSATTATDANTASAIVSRNASGNFTAGTITAALTGIASGNVITNGALGTPSSGTLTSCTGLPISTGVSGLGTGAATFLATPSSANLAALLTDETGSGAAVFATSPTLVSPALGTPVSGVLTNCTNLPVATVSVVGAIAPGTGLSVTGGGVLNHVNSVTAGTTSGITFDAQGHITSSVALAGADLPIATGGVIGGVRPGTGLTVDGSGILAVTAATNAALGGVIAGTDFGITTGTISLATQATLTPGTYTKSTFNSKGIATGGETLVAGDIPNLDANQITSGSLDIARIAANTVTGAKIANYAVTKIGDTQPTADYIGQFFFNPLSRDLALFDGNVYQPIGISIGEIVFAGTFDASLGSGTGLINSVTQEGTAIGLAIGQTLPAPAAGNSRFYFVVAEGGTITTGNAPHVVLAPPDILLSNGITWTEIDVSQTITAQTANNISFTPAGSIVSVNVQTAIQELDGDKLPIAGGTITGNLEIGAAGSLSFEGSTTNDFETFIAVVDPTADRTITLPNITGTVVTTGDTGTVTSTMLLDGTILNEDINASAAIAYSKLATLSSANIVLGSSANVATGTAITGDVTIDNTGVTAISAGVIVNADVSVSAAIVDTKLDTIATALKVSNSATTAASANTASAIVARDASGNFTAGTITAALTGNASTVTTNANLTGDVTSTGNATAIAAGVIVNADVNASAAIAGTKVAPNFGAQTITTTGVISPALGTAALPSVAFTGDTNTGIFSPGADQVAVSTGGVQRINIEADGDINIDSGGVFYDATNNRLAIGTTSPSAPLHVKSTNPQVIVDSPDASTESRVRWFKNGSTVGQVSSLSGNLNILSESALTFSVNGGSPPEAARIDSSGRLLVGTSSVTGIPATLNVIGGNNTVLHSQGANADSPFLFLSHARGTAAQTVNAQDGVGAVAFVGYDGTNALTSARIEAFVDGTPGANDMPGRLVFSVTGDGSASPTEAMRINNQREVLIGTTTRNANGGILQLTSGITFPATAVAATDANTLDDYEEGTWTTSITWDTPGTFTATLEDNTVSRYTKIGRTVYVIAYIGITAFNKGTASGAWYFTGLPFNINSAGGIRPTGTLVTFQAPFASTPMIYGEANSALVRPITLTDNASFAGLSDPDANSVYFFSLTYDVT